MNPLLLAGLAALAYALGYRFYARRLERTFGIDDARPTPAVAKEDGADYVPSPVHVVFAHHFSAVAAAGPILGPTWALLYGALPVWAWIVAGGIFLGAMHDMAALFVSIREEGRSVAEVARRTLGTRAYALFVLFILFNLVLVNATFLNATATSLVAMQPPRALGLAEDQSIFRTVPSPTGAPLCVVGGIASTSAIALTAVAPLLGWLLVRRNLRNAIAYPLATALCVGSVLVGFVAPVSLGYGTWVGVLTVYVLVAAAVPVWMILQPREFISVQFLYLGIGAIALALVGAGLRGVPLQAPGWSVAAGEEVLGGVWPALFVTVACGAISGFHGLVASGTTAKQVARESHIRPVAYGGMLGESVLAMLVTLAVGLGVSHADYLAVLVRAPDAPPEWRANPTLAFSLGVAGTLDLGLGIPRWAGVVAGLLMVEGFVLDTLDVSVRLHRYLLEELWALLFRGRPPAFLVGRAGAVLNSLVAVGLMLGLLAGNTADRLWPIFGAGNQLFAALSLVTVSVWLRRRGRSVLFTLGPGLLLLGTTLTSLALQVRGKYWAQGNTTLAALGVAFIALAILFLFEAARAWRRAAEGTAEGGAAERASTQPPS